MDSSGGWTAAFDRTEDLRGHPEAGGLEGPGILLGAALRALRLPAAGGIAALAAGMDNSERLRPRTPALHRSIANGARVRAAIGGAPGSATTL
jgi:hypothetical protein